MGGNVGTDKYVFLIDIVQKITLEPVLGTKLYEKIQADYNTNSLSGLYLQMHSDYIEPFLNYAVYAKYAHSGSNRVRNNGNLRTTPNNAEVMSNEDNISTENEYRNVSNLFLGGLEDFLSYEGVNIPEYQTQDNDYDSEAKDNDGYNCITWHLK